MQCAELREKGQAECRMPNADPSYLQGNNVRKSKGYCSLLLLNLVVCHCSSALLLIKNLSHKRLTFSSVARLSLVLALWPPVSAWLVAPTRRHTSRLYSSPQELVTQCLTESVQQMIQVMTTEFFDASPSLECPAGPMRATHRNQTFRTPVGDFVCQDQLTKRNHHQFLSSTRIGN